ncbi:LysE/ArgO family amino acid transporter [Desulfosediminicola flagellatus]|uniref:LysE/ArgO family amino acid transporter n=1 Tax=Desulfosediminicola flagellatus TaxID=2569541 RepID=UPI0010AC1B85|nr:LysE/ArgO family amino acid transporter [Desulfosediminicola flagellatus]
MIAFLQGMGTGAGLIIAIGAQNAFVLSQGVRREHNWLVAFICSLCDAVLIFIGAAGVGLAVAKNPMLREIAGWGGALFLVYYGFCSMKAAFKAEALDDSTTDTYSSRWAILVATLAVTLLNPHVYLDTLVLIGSLSGQFDADGRYLFALGASVASFIWFYALSLGGSLLAPVFKSRNAWRVLDFLVCMTMWVIAWQIVPL